MGDVCFCVVSVQFFHGMEVYFYSVHHSKKCFILFSLVLILIIGRQVFIFDHLWSYFLIFSSLQILQGSIGSIHVSNGQIQWFLSFYNAVSQDKEAGCKGMEFDVFKTLVLVELKNGNSYWES